ncbi:LPXTG cell wall anchor domain-containing protein [Mesobacillus boroniphilus]|uniref:LPXTG cell wall anchor domain-containing protein n=1 Tax=Mesobacillus boroniphilus TaxID=308892 RepID=A0A944CPS9_9BACI|nr:leucine-rich repeat domain-containing protein [Mesobacillus boroniphilus]MBS8265668.1 LPXTG cell wall anchor domain-containing protein [Mesobacillus boroniphilus]
MHKVKWLTMTLVIMLLMTSLSPLTAIKADYYDLSFISMELAEDHQIVLSWEGYIENGTDIDRFEIKRNDEIIEIENLEPVYSEEMGDGLLKLVEYQYIDQLTAEEIQSPYEEITYQVTGWIGEKTLLSGQQILIVDHSSGGNDTTGTEEGIYFDLGMANDETLALQFYYYGPDEYDGAISYRIFLDGVEYDQVEGAQDNYQIGNLAPATDYEIKVVALNEAGNELLEETRIFTTLEGPTGEVVVFPDANLEQAIKNQLNLERDLYQSDLEDVTYLDAAGLGISDLTGINQLENVTMLMLDENEITDVSMLASLQNLGHLGLSDNPITDGTSLGNITSLTFIGLGNVKITDFSFMEQLSNLDSVRLDGNQIMSIDFLAGKEKLSWIQLSDNQITDLSPIYSFKDLRVLEVKNNPISSLAGIEGLANLRILDLSLTDLTELSALEAMDTLGYLGLLDMPVMDLTENSPSRATIEKWEDKGVYVDFFNPANELEGVLQVEEVSTNSIRISWENGNDYEIDTIRLNGDTHSPEEGTTYTFTNLSSGQKYIVTIQAFDTTSSAVMYETVVLHTLAAPKDDEPVNPEEPNKGESEPKTVVAVPAVTNGKASVSNEEVAKVEAGGTFEVSLVTEENQQEIDIVLTKEQLKELKDKGASLSVKDQEVTLGFPLSIFAEEDTNLQLKKLPAVNDARSAVYDFTITQGDTIVSQFSEPVTLTFNVNLDGLEDPSNLKVFYFNEETKEWELIGGTYENGEVTAQTNHFSIYTVFEVTSSGDVPSNQNPANAESDEEAGITPEENDSDQTTVESSQPGTNQQTENTVENKDAVQSEDIQNNESDQTTETQKNELPDTATNTFNVIAAGLALIVFATLFLLSTKRREV